jgi:hypothetical protein
LPPPRELDGAPPRTAWLPRTPIRRGPGAHDARDARRVVPPARRARLPPRTHRAPRRMATCEPASEQRDRLGSGARRHVGTGRGDRRCVHVTPPTGGTRAWPDAADA